MSGIKKNKPERSKSIGRSPSRSFDLSKILKHKKKEHLNHEDSESEVEEKKDSRIEGKLEEVLLKMNTLGNLTNELDKKKVDGVALDKIMRDLFTQYSTEKDLYSERFLMMNACRKHKDLFPPSNLKKSSKKTDLDRATKLQRIFSTVPTFTNDKSFTMRELLSNMNSIVETLGADISENEYELILMQKMSPRVKNALSGYKHDNLKGLFANLLNIYDSSETHHEALSALVNQKCKFSSLHEYIEETLRLLSLSRKNGDQQSQLFVHSIEGLVPKRIWEKLTEFLDNYEIIHEGRYPPLPVLIDFIYKYRAEIDANLSKCHKKYNFNEMGFENDEAETEEKAKCAICKRNNHTTENCFRTAICANCNAKGHIEKYCKKLKVCQKCGRSGHSVSTCNVKCRLCNNPAHTSVQCNLYPGLEPAQAPCSRCQDSLFVNLYHPRNMCKQSPKN